MAQGLVGARRLALLPVLLVAFFFCGCAAARTTGKVVVTPVTVVRDVVDAPVVSLTNVCELFASWSNPRSAPQPNVGWSYKGGFNFGIGWNPAWLFFKACSGIIGSVDYLVCRSLYPSWPAGESPWLKEGESWWSLYFPNTRALWGDNPPDTYEEAERRRKAAEQPPSPPA